MINPSQKSIIFATTLSIFFGWGVMWSILNGGTFVMERLGSFFASSQTREFSASASLYIPSTPTTTAPVAEPIKDSVSDKTFKLMVGGDVMLDRNLRKIGEEKGYGSLFYEISPLFHGADAAVVNLEGPVTLNHSKTLLSNGSTTKVLLFTFATTSLAALRDAGVTAVSLANNHTDNFGYKGFKETKQWLDISGIKYFGDPWNSSSTETVIDKGNFHIALVGYHAFQPGFDRVISEVKKLSNKGNMVVVMPHWGDEYMKVHSSKMESQARALVAAGADAIIGSHPHVIMDNQIISGVPVYYSIGNLIFDQYFSEDTMKGDVVELDFIYDGVGGQKLDHVAVHEINSAPR